LTKALEGISGAFGGLTLAPSPRPDEAPPPELDADLAAEAHAAAQEAAEKAAEAAAVAEASATPGPLGLPGSAGTPVDDILSPPQHRPENA
jgi:hypothetical protein